MDNQVGEQAEYSREILLFPDQDNADAVKNLKKLSTEENPSLAVLLDSLDSLSNDNKALVTDFAKDTPFPKSVINIVIENKLINTEGPGWNAYRNAIIRLSFVLSKYFSISHISEFTEAQWHVVLQALVDKENFWRNKSAHSIQNSARTFVKVVNVSQGEYQIALRANKIIGGGARAGRQTQIAYLMRKGQNYRDWLPLFNEWRENQLLKNSKSLNASLSLFIRFLQTHDYDIAPADFLMIPKKPNYWTYLTKDIVGVSAKTLRSHALRMYEFTEWIIREKLSDEDNDQLITAATPLLTLDLYHFVSSYKVPSTRGKADNVKAILPIKYLNLIRQILTENDHKWPRTQEWTYQSMLNHDTGEIERVWHPHLTYLYLFLLEVPVRKIQVLCLDSGEGDDSQWEDGEWRPNSSVHAKYWSKNYGDSLGRGVTRKTYNNGIESTSIYINTNKTQDIQKGFGATSGYTINWHNESLLKVIKSMRDWQTKYNPVKGPVRYRDLPKNTFSDSPTEAVLELIPDRFYLFRYPLNHASNPEHRAAPPADYLTFRFWHLLMNELERRLNEMGEKVVITTGWTGGLPNKSIFTPHSLRGSGLTALSEAGVPIEVLSKVVAGHASILMTLGYIKYNSAYISSVLDKARLKVEQTEQENYTQYLRSATWDDAYRYAVLNEGLEKEDLEASQAVNLFENRQIGVCPNSGTRCWEGGGVIKKKGEGKPGHGPVAGGNGNCVRCRFLMTGLPFLVPLWLKANKDLADAQEISVQVEAAVRELEKLRSKRYRIAKEQGSQHIPLSLQTEIKQVEARLDVKSAKLDEVLSNAHATYNLVERVKILAKEDNSNLPTLLNDEMGVNSDSDFQEVSLFTQRDFIVQASRLYPHIKDKQIEMERNHFIDQIMFNLGMTPISLSSLTEEEKKAACDSAASFLNARLSCQEIQMLESGALDIRELGISDSDSQEFVKSVKTGIQRIALTEIK